MTIHTDKSNLRELLNDIKSISREKLNLVLLGHANEDSEAIANVSVNDTIGILRDNENINRVTLLGCNTAKSLTLNQETSMIQKFIMDEHRKAKLNQEHGFGLILMSRPPAEDDYSKILDKIKKDKLGEVVDRAFIIIKEMMGDLIQYKLVYVERTGNDFVIETAPFDQDKITALQDHFNKGKPFVFPDGELKTYVRGGRGAEKLSLDEILCIANILQGCSIFDKNHPSYKETKSLYPFLSHLKMNKTEQEKLLNSLLKHLVEAIQQDPEIQRMIVVKGYTKALHVDTKAQRMHVTRTHLYPIDYLFSLFADKAANIDERKLEEERRKTLETMKQGKDGEPTTAKSISFIIEPDRNTNNNNSNNNNFHS